MANGFQGPPAVDFYSQLSGLGDVIQANRVAQAKRDAFAQATMPGADGKIDYGRAVLGLAQVDPQAASLFAQRQNHEDVLKQQEVANKRAEAAAAQAERHFQANYSLSKRAADRADDPTPDNFVADASVPGGYRPIGPADPAYKAKVAGAATVEEINQRAALAPNYGIDRGTPEFKTFVLTGKLPDSVANGGQPEVGLNPAYGVGPDGKPAAVQFSKTGKAVQTQLPEGFSLSKEPIKVDLGTHIQLIDPITRQPIGQPILKNIAGAEAAKEEGSAQGLARVALPQALATADQTLKTIEELKVHPGLDHSVGMWSVVPNVPGGQGADFNAKANQLKGQTFLQAYQTLRGSGAITDIEGKKGEDAIAALDRAQSKKQYVAALNDLKTVIQGGMLRAKAKAGMDSSAPSASAPADPLGIR